MDNSPFFNVVSPPHHPLPLRTCAFIDILPPILIFFKNCPITQFARKIKTVVQVDFGLFPLFDQNHPRAAQKFLRKQAFRHRRCHFVRGKLPYFLPCAAHMKIRESSTLKFITKNFSAKHHNNFSAQRSNFRCKPAKCALCFVH